MAVLPRSWTSGTRRGQTVAIFVGACLLYGLFIVNQPPHSDAPWSEGNSNSNGGGGAGGGHARAPRAPGMNGPDGEHEGTFADIEQVLDKEKNAREAREVDAAARKFRESQERIEKLNAERAERAGRMADEKERAAKESAELKERVLKQAAANMAAQKAAAAALVAKPASGIFFETHEHASCQGYAEKRVKERSLEDSKTECLANDDCHAIECNHGMTRGGCTLRLVAHTIEYFPTDCFLLVDPEDEKASLCI